MIPPLVPGDSAVVLGLGLYGRAVATALLRRGIDVIAIEDNPSEATDGFAASSGVDYVPTPDSMRLEAVMAGAPTSFAPSPGVPELHPAFELARRHDVPVISEFDMARWWDDRPIGAVTGTDGKTTVTVLTVEMLEASGVPAMVVGNTETPLIEAIDSDLVDVEVFVVEASSFRLAHTQWFAPKVGVWLNFGPDHLDVHADLDSYEAAKAKIWAGLPDDGVAIANSDDRVVMSHLPTGRRIITIGGPGSDGHRKGDELILHGEALASIDDMVRAFEHDVTNTLAAGALALELGGTRAGIVEAVRNQRLLPHRIEHVATIGGVDYYNDSKATVPHAVLTALNAFDRVVLIAGGRNKGLDLTVLAQASDRIQAVVAVGEAAGEVDAAFGDVSTVVAARDMAHAVDLASDLAEPGGVVLLSPGCASYDAYTSYIARGEDFVRLVRALGEGAPQ